MVTDTAKGTRIRRRLARNTFTNYIARIIMLGAGFLLTPYLLRQLGTTTYGLWVLVGSVAGYSSLLDFGIAQSVVKYVAEYRAKGELEQAHHLVATALWLYSLLGLVTVALAMLIAPLFPSLFSVPAEQHDIAVALVRLAGVAAGLSIPCTITISVLRGLQRFDVVNVISVVGTLGTLAGTVLVLWLGGSIIGIVLVNILLTVVTQIPTVWYIRHTWPELGLGWRGARRRYVGTIIEYSASFFVMNIAGQLETKTDEIVIGAFMSVGAVTPYALARRLSEITQILTDQFLKVLLPLASELHAENDWDRLRLLYTTSSRLTLAIFLAIGCPVMMLAPALLRVWVGEAQSQYAYLVVILTLASLLSVSQWPAGAILQGMARHRLPALTALGSGLLNLALSIFLLSRFGLVGVAVGTLIPTALESIGFVLPYAMRSLGISVKELLQTIVLPALLPVAPTLIVLALLPQVLDLRSLLSVLVAVALGALTYLVGYLLMGTSHLERHAYRDVAQSAYHLVEARLRGIGLI